MTNAHQRAAQMLAAAADLLDQGQIANRMSLAATAIAFGALLLPIVPTSEATLPTAAIVGVIGMVELFFAARVSLEAALFRRLASDAAAERLDVSAFDNALVTLKLMSQEKSGRTIAKRFAGAKRLLLLQQAALVLQVIATIGGAAAGYFNLA